MNCILFSIVVCLFIFYFNYVSLIQAFDINTLPSVNRIRHKLYEADSTYEIVHISKRTHPVYTIPVFGKNLVLKLEPNYHLTSPNFVTKIYDGSRKEEIKSNTNCHYLHSSNSMTAAMDLCKPDKMFGFIFLDYAAIEINPLNDGILGIQGFPHVIKTINLTYNIWRALLRNVMNKNLPIRESDIKLDITKKEQNFTNNKRGANKGPFLEAGLFLDEAGYKLFAPFFKNDNAQLKDMLLAYINGVQALYHHPTAGTKLDIILTNLEILKKQPPDLPHYSGERSALLDSFCAFNEKHNPPKDNDPKHWDIGIYLSGLDFFSVDNGRRSSITMGLSAVGGICTPKYSCLIAELGTTNVFGKPYPSAGFTSVYVLAHEIGHNLGMHHDSSSNNCPKDGFIMSPSRGVMGETLWSTCSAEILKKLSTTAKCLYDVSKAKANTHLNHMKFKEKPGAIWGSNKQCEILLKDHDAKSRNAEKTEAICQSLQCETKHKSGVFLAGPALEGTACGKDKWCHAGECIRKSKSK